MATTATTAHAGAAAPITVTTTAQRTRQTTQTPGMLREEMYASPTVWIGEVRTAPGITSGWHHHADYESFIYVISGQIRMEFGVDGAQTCEGGPGDLLHVPTHAIHRESNPGDSEQVLLVMRAGAGTTPVYNVDGPAGS